MRSTPGAMPPCGGAPNYVTEQQLRELHIKIRGTNEGDVKPVK